MRPITEFDTDSVLGNMLQITGVLIFVIGISVTLLGTGNAAVEFIIIGVGAIILSFVLFAMGSIYTIVYVNHKMNKEMYVYLYDKISTEIPLP